LARLYAAYHNSLVQQNLNIKPPDVRSAPHTPSDTESDGSAAESLETQAPWDEKEFGDRAYNDNTFELNANLLPWTQKGIDAEEKWGL